MELFSMTSTFIAGAGRVRQRIGERACRLFGSIEDAKLYTAGLEGDGELWLVPGIGIIPLDFYPRIRGFTQRYTTSVSRFTST